MLRRTSAAAIFVMLGLVVIGPAANATPFYDPGYPLLTTDALGANGWTSYRFSVAADGTEVTVLGQGIVGGAAVGSVGLYLLNGAGSLLAGFVASGLGEGDELHVSAADPVGVIIDQRAGLISGLMGAAMGVGLSAGEYVAVVIVTADGTVSGGEADLFGQAGTTLLHKTSGANGFLDRTPDFQGTANVYANHIVPLPYVDPGVGIPVGGFGVGAGAAVIVEGSVSHTVQHKLFAFWQDFGPTLFVPLGGIDPQMEWQGPNSSGNGASTYFITNEGAGAYDFIVHLDAEAGAVFNPQIFLTGADVELA
jgi:hypothetical protein